jgi:hypothetical protein
MSAKQNVHFNSQVKQIGRFADNATNDSIKNEPMFFNCDLEFAYKNGGEITKSFIESLPLEWKLGKTIFDSRVHMLMPGWYPAIPGFHHDDVPRPKIPVGQHFASSGQPDYDNMRYKAEHILGLVNANICPTVFACGKCEMPHINDGELIYRKWHKTVEQLLKDGLLTQIDAQDRTLYYFDWETFHTGQKAISNGWRWFGRVSRNTDRVNDVTNEIRQQVQVYLEFPMEGW